MINRNSMTEYEYIIDSTGLKQRYDRITQIITALENQMILAAGNSTTEEYSLNDGQIQIRTMYRSPDSISKAIDAFEKIRNRILAELTGTTRVRLADAQTIQSNGH